MKKLIALGIMGLSSLTHGAPAEVYDGRAVSNFTNSPVLRDNKDNTRLYVLPPSEGRLANRTDSFLVAESTCLNLSEILQDVRVNQSQLRQLKNQLFNIQMALSSDDGVDVEKSSRLRRQYKEMSDMVKEYEADIQDTLKRYATKAGGYIRLEFTTPWSDNLYHIKNSNYFENVTKLEGNNMQIAMTIPGLGEDEEGSTFFKSFAINGVSSKNLASAANQKTSEKLMVELAITELTACYFKFPSLFGIQGSPAFSLSTTYDIPRSFAFNINAKVNLWNVYKFVHEKGSSGGFFSSSSWSKTIESDWGEQTFSIKWDEEDPEGKYSQEDRMKIASTIKMDLLANLSKMIMLKMNVDPNMAGPAGARGASVLADGLQKYPDPYAQAAALGLRVLDSVFGSSSSRTEIQKTLNKTVIENYSWNTARYVKYTTVYSE